MQWNGDNNALKKGEKREFECFEEIPKARETRVTLWFVSFKIWELTPEWFPKAREIQALERFPKAREIQASIPFLMIFTFLLMFFRCFLCIFYGILFEYLLDILCCKRKRMKRGGLA